MASVMKYYLALKQINRLRTTNRILVYIIITMGAALIGLVLGLCKAGVI